MLVKLGLANQMNEDLVLAFITRMKGVEADNLLVEFASNEMRNKLNSKRESGWSGWNTPQCSNDDLYGRLIKNAEKHDWVDVLNLAAMLLARESIFKETVLVKP